MQSENIYYLGLNQIRSHFYINININYIMQRGKEI
jgi:hypothetical protein